jgi:hypothetical protein
MGALRELERADREQRKRGDDALRHAEKSHVPPPICPYCSAPTALVKSDVVYPHRPDLAGKKFWLCHPCDAYVGCHPGTERPLGTPANADLRALRSKVHAALDPLWRGGRLRRSEAYERLAVAMGIPGEECHVGMFDEARCRDALAAIRSI